MNIRKTATRHLTTLQYNYSDTDAVRDAADGLEAVIEHLLSVEAFARDVVEKDMIRHRNLKEALKKIDESP